MLRLFSLLQLLLNVLIVSAQDDALHFTSGITSPAPVPGQPFTITWAGGDENTTVYIVLNYLFPDTPNQDIPYIMTDILCMLFAVLFVIYNNGRTDRAQPMHQITAPGRIMSL